MASHSSYIIFFLKWNNSCSYESIVYTGADDDTSKVVNPSDPACEVCETNTL